MRLVSWNIRMAAHQKLEPIMALRPDILVLPECAHPDVLQKKAPGLPIADACWQGRSKHKGLAVLAFGDWRFTVSRDYDPRFEMFLPIHVSGPLEFRLLAVWAFNHRSRAFPRRSQHATRRAIEYYEPFLGATPSIVSGDFNNNVAWDDGRYPRFRYVLDILDGVGLASVHHTYSSEEHGAESTPTYRHSSADTYHIDYMFLPETWIRKISYFEVGQHEAWGALSDHVPLIVEVAAPNEESPRISKAPQGCHSAVEREST